MDARKFFQPAETAGQGDGAGLLSRRPIHGQSDRLPGLRMTVLDHGLGRRGRSS